MMYNGLIKSQFLCVIKQKNLYLILLYCLASSLYVSILLNVDPHYDMYYSGGYNAITGVIKFVLHHVATGHILASAIFEEEYHTGTLGMLLLSGVSRIKILLAKIAVFLFFNLIISAIYLVVVVTAFTIHFGTFGIEMNLGNIFRIMWILLLGTISSFTLGCIIVLFSILIRKKIWSIAAGLFITYFVAQLDNANREDPLPFIEYTWLYPIRHLSWDIDIRGTLFYIAVTGITAIVAVILAFWVFERQEIF